MTDILPMESALRKELRKAPDHTDHGFDLHRNTIWVARYGIERFASIVEEKLSISRVVHAEDEVLAWQENVTLTYDGTHYFLDVQMGIPFQSELTLKGVKEYKQAQLLEPKGIEMALRIKDAPFDANLLEATVHDYVSQYAMAKKKFRRVG